ncbi:hypothetical protein, partial [Fulvivirga marina]|uniref:hypothetical protein n=1 Tax=Fulvivirga marina TaxID=2494733 RepID=UPI001EE24453
LTLHDLERPLNSRHSSLMNKSIQLATVNVTKYMACCSRIGILSSHVSKISIKESTRADALYHFRS